MELSKNPYVYALWGLVVLAVGAGVAAHKITAETAVALLVGLGLPSVLGGKSKEETKP